MSGKLRVWSVILVLGFFFKADRAIAQTTTQWTPHELSFTATADHAWHDFPLNVTFSHASGSKLSLTGFWDGGKTWKVLFSPTQEGAWTWNSVSTDSGMNGKNGTVNAVTPTVAAINTNPNLRGHLKIAGGRYFTYADDTPFFWLGDTNWHMNSTQYPLGGGSGGFYTWLNNRKTKNFTAVFTQFYSLDLQNEGGHAFPNNTAGSSGNGNFTAINPEFFRQMDTRVQAISDAGLVLAVHPSWISKHEMSLADAKRVYRYLVSRYGAYNVVWSLSGEYQYKYGSTNNWDSVPWTKSDWDNLGAAVDSYDSYNHPTTIHPSSRDIDPGGWGADAIKQSSGAQFHGSSWLDHNWLQTGKGTNELYQLSDRVAENYARTPAKPVIESEGWYENAAKDIRATDYEIRWQAWASYLNGAVGFGYGADGVWNGQSNWQQALDFAGAGQMTHVKNFFSAINWWELVPQRDWITVNGSTPRDTGSRTTDPHLAAKADSLVAIYIPKGNSGKTLTVSNIGSAAYTAKWFNPKNGQFTNIGSVAPAGGQWTVPNRPAPANEDWVVLLSTSAAPGMTLSPVQTPGNKWTNILASWLTNASAYDTNQDGLVNLFDFK